jgi:hypothetical protein
MPEDRAPVSSPAYAGSRALTAVSSVRLTDEQVASLRACARGISLRFERRDIVRALVAGGYAEENVAGVVRVTAEGHAYLRTRDR